MVRLKQLKSELEKGRQDLANERATNARLVQEIQRAQQSKNDGVNSGELEARLDALKLQHNAFRDEVTERLETKNRRARQLQEENVRLRNSLGLKQEDGGSSHDHENSGAKANASANSREVDTWKRRCATHLKVAVFELCLVVDASTSPCLCCLGRNVLRFKRSWRARSSSLRTTLRPKRVRLACTIPKMNACRAKSRFVVLLFLFSKPCVHIPTLHVMAAAYCCNRLFSGSSMRRLRRYETARLDLT